MKKKEKTIGLVMSIIISAAMGAISAFLVRKGNPDSTKTSPAFMMYFSNIILSVIVGIIVVFVIPLGKMGKILASKFNARPMTMKFNLLNAIPLAVGNTIIVSMVTSLYGIFMARSNAPDDVVEKLPPFFVMWISNWAKLLPPTLIVSYVLAVALAPIVVLAVGIKGTEE